MSERKRSEATVDITNAPEDRILLACSIGTAETSEFKLEIVGSGDTLEFAFKAEGKVTRRYWVNIRPIANKAISVYRRDVGLTEVELR